MPLTKVITKNKTGNKKKGRRGNQHKQNGGRQIHRTLKTRENNNNNNKKKKQRLWPFFVSACVRKITSTVRQLSGRAFLGGEN